jgi:hypothetical protein
MNSLIAHGFIARTAVLPMTDVFYMFYTNVRISLTPLQHSV